MNARWRDETPFSRQQYGLLGARRPGSNVFYANFEQLRQRS
jgi:hypothetical protein